MRWWWLLERPKDGSNIENQIKSYQGVLVPERNQNVDQVMWKQGTSDQEMLVLIINDEKAVGDVWIRDESWPTSDYISENHCINDLLDPWMKVEL